MREHLVRRFADAGLQLVLSDRPMIGGVRGGRDIVQIDIQRRTDGSRRHEWFRIFAGAAENRIEVVGTDKRHGQVVLMVHEPVREFIEEIPSWQLRDVDTDGESWKDGLARRFNVRVSAIKAAVGRGGRITKLEVTRKTDAQKRHFLCGLDERQLFIAQLPKAVSTVRDAHACLKTTTVTLAEGQGINTTRQGEWFFLEPSAEELAAIEAGIEKGTINVERTVPIGPFSDGSSARSRSKVRQFRGNPHTAEELVVLPGKPLDHGFSVRGREVYIRGKVRHVDHKTVSFKSWRKVIRNAEPNAGQASGVGWVD